eukprot:9214765-Ditylum_brightwellii.AAC.1
MAPWWAQVETCCNHSLQHNGSITLHAITTLSGIMSGSAAHPHPAKLTGMILPAPSAREAAS